MKLFESSWSGLYLMYTGHICEHLNAMPREISIDAKCISQRPGLEDLTSQADVPSQRTA